MKTSLFFILAIFLSCGFANAAPKDFQVVYFTSAGQLEKATIEKITVKEGAAVMDREAVQVGGSGEKKKDSKSYKISSAQLDELLSIVQASGFMTWPGTGEAPHQSQVVEYFEITLDGKTVKRTRWEGGNQERFRQLYEDFNRWYTGIRAAHF